MARVLVTAGILLAAATARLAPPCASAATVACTAAACEDATGFDLCDLDALPVDPIDLPAPEAVAIHVAPLAPRAVLATADLLRVAPKTSPPAVVA